MIFINIKSGLGDTLFSWAECWKMHISKGFAVNFVWDYKVRNSKQFQYYFSVPSGINVINIADEFDMIKEFSIDRVVSHLRRNGRQISNRTCAASARRYLETEYLQDDLQGKRVLISMCTVLGKGMDRSEFFDFFKPSEAINSKMNKFIQDTGFDSPIGMHIRRTDHINIIKESPSYLFTDKIEELLSENPHAKIFLACDDNDLKQSIVSKYGDSILTREINPRFSDNGMEDSVVDLFLLSKCRTIYGTRSHFCNLAGKIGHIQVEQLAKL